MFIVRNKSLFHVLSADIKLWISFCPFRSPLLCNGFASQVRPFVYTSSLNNNASFKSPPRDG